MWKLTVISSLILYAVQAADFEACPARIDVRPQELVKAVPGWTAGQAHEAHHELVSVDLYDGHPSELASLIPDTQAKLKIGWTLHPQTRPYWLQCHYTQTTLVLSRA